MKLIVPAAVFLLMVSVVMSLRPKRRCPVTSDGVATLGGAGVGNVHRPGGTRVTAGAHPAAATGGEVG
jgi:hypothetical protein